MKNYIAFADGTAHNSGLKTYDGAVEWATNWLMTQAKVSRVYIANVTCTVERDVLPIIVRDFHPEVAKDEPALKIA